MKPSDFICDCEITPALNECEHADTTISCEHTKLDSCTNFPHSNSSEFPYNGKPPNETIYLNNTVLSVVTRYNNGTIVHRDMDKHFHRDNESPAITKGFVVGNIIFHNELSKEYWVHGKRHRIGGPARILPRGEEYWVDDQLHRDEDEPSKIQYYTHNNVISWWKIWYQKGREYRIDNRPTRVHSSGILEWHNSSGQLHRKILNKHLPARVDPNNCMEWFCKGVRHRDYGLPAIVYINESREWYQDGKRYREDGKPAQIMYGCLNYYWSCDYEYCDYSSPTGLVGTFDDKNIYYFCVDVYNSTEEQFEVLLKTLDILHRAISTIIHYEDTIWSFTFVRRLNKHPDGKLNIIIYSDKDNDLICDMHDKNNIISCFEDTHDFNLHRNSPLVHTVCYKNSFHITDKSGILDTCVKIGLESLPVLDG